MSKPIDRARELFEQMGNIADDDKCIALLADALIQRPASVAVPDIGAIIRQIPTGYFEDGRRGQHASRESVARLAERELRELLAAAPHPVSGDA